jgi:hypothetical protein
MRFFLTAAAVLLLVALAGAYALLRPNRAQLASTLEIESWDVVADGEHNSNTDMIFWRDHFWLIHAASPYHMGTPKSRLVIRRSSDTRSWETVTSLQVAGKDIRDPKFAPIAGRLFLYALSNEGFFATPEGSVVSTSRDGKTWSEFRPVGPKGCQVGRRENLVRARLLVGSRQVRPASLPGRRRVGAGIDHLRG